MQISKYMEAQHTQTQNKIVVDVCDAWFGKDTQQYVSVTE